MAETSNAGFIDWEQVQVLPESSSSACSINGREGQVAAPTTPPPLPPPVFVDDFSNVFPPSCHEGLLVQIEPDPSSPLPSQPFWADVLQPHPSSDSRVQVRANFVRRLKSGIGVLYANLLMLRKNMFPCCFSRRAVLSYSAGVAMGLFGVLLYLRRRRRRPSGNDSLLLLIREKDEKISQLLRQVAQMNEKISQLLHHIAQMNDALSAQQRIPVIRSS